MNGIQNLHEGYNHFINLNNQTISSLDKVILGIAIGALLVIGLVWLKHGNIFWNKQLSTQDLTHSLQQQQEGTTNPPQIKVTANPQVTDTTQDLTHPPKQQQARAEGTTTSPQKEVISNPQVTNTTHDSTPPSKQQQAQIAVTTTAPQVVQPTPSAVDTTIYFYDKGKSYYELTNFFENWRHGTLHYVVYNGKNWKTSEHAFQAEKFNYLSTQAQQVRDQILNAPTAREAFNLARQNQSLTRSGWHQMKDNVMLEILRCKFSDQHLTNVLRKTNTRSLVEASPVDAYWGYGPDKKGTNRLGQLLMQVRKEKFGF